MSCLRQFHAGEECYVARVDGVIAHCNWIRYHGCGRVDGRPVTLETGEVYTTDAFTGEAFRGRGLHELVLSYMLEQARVRGNHRAYTITDMMKAGSRRGVKRLAWERRGVILYVTPRAMGRTWLFRLSGDLEPIFSQARTSVAQV